MATNRDASAIRGKRIGYAAADPAPSPPVLAQPTAIANAGMSLSNNGNAILSNPQRPYQPLSLAGTYPIMHPNPMMAMMGPNPMMMGPNPMMMGPMVMGPNQTMMAQMAPMMMARNQTMMARNQMTMMSRMMVARNQMPMTAPMMMAPNQMFHPPPSRTGASATARAPRPQPPPKRKLTKLEKEEQKAERDRKRKLTKLEKEEKKVERDRKHIEDLLDKGRDFNSVSIFRILKRSPAVGHLKIPNELLSKWAPFLESIFTSNIESWRGLIAVSKRSSGFGWRVSEVDLSNAGIGVAFRLQSQDSNGSIVFRSETGDVPKRNGLTRWNSMDLNYCDLNDPVFAEFFSHLGPVGNMLHEIGIGEGRESYYDYRYSCPIAGPDPARGREEGDVPEITKEAMSSCLAALLRSGCTQNLRVICILNDKRFHSSLDWGTMVAAMKDHLANIPQLRTIEMECGNMGKAPPEEVKAWVDYLQYQNKTLERLPGTTIGKDEAIQNYLYLNRLGRAKAANCEGGDELVQLLCPSKTLDRKKRSKLNRCNLIYGLLREAPGLWAKHCAGTLSATANAKPKAKANKKRKSIAGETRSQPKRQSRSKSAKH